jgi:hypothetical protein
MQTEIDAWLGLVARTAGVATDGPREHVIAELLKQSDPCIDGMHISAYCTYLRCLVHAGTPLLDDEVWLLVRILVHAISVVCNVLDYAHAKELHHLVGLMRLIKDSPLITEHSKITIAVAIACTRDSIPVAKGLDEFSSSWDIDTALLESHFEPICQHCWDHTAGNTQQVRNPCSKWIVVMLCVAVMMAVMQILQDRMR